MACYSLEEGSHSTFLTGTTNLAQDYAETYPQKRREMTSAGRILLIIFVTTLLVGCETEEKPQPLLTIKLGGQSCELYQGALNSALTKLPGVEQIDFTSQPGHVLVRGNPQLMNATQVLAAINNLQGEGWSCEGQFVN